MNSIDRELIAALMRHNFPTPAPETRPRKAKEIREQNRIRSASHKRVGKATNYDSCTERGGFTPMWATGARRK